MKIQRGPREADPSAGCTIISKERLVTEEVKAHEVSTSMVKAALPELDAGTHMALKVGVWCSCKCNLQGCRVAIVDDESGTVREIELAEFDALANETEEFVVKAPFEPGGYAWTAVFPAQEKQGLLHGESSAPFSFVVRPHATSLEVLDAPDPVGFGDEFKIKVGVKCSADCKLTGKEIEIYDHEGAKVATATLGDVPWSGATALSCAEVELKAPSIERRYRWTVKFPKPDLDLAHEEASCTFAFGAVGQPEDVVTIEVIDRDTKAPIKNASVLLRPLLYRGSAYRSRTDDGGVARVSVPKGDYQLHVSGDGKESSWPIVKVASDIAIKAELFVLEREWWED